MKNNNPEALMSEDDDPKRLLSRSFGRVSKEVRTVTCNELRIRAESELRALAYFICGHEYIATANQLSLDDELFSRAIGVASSFQIRFLRGELLKRVIQALRREVEELIRPYEELARSNVGAKEALEWPEVLSSLELRANQLNLLHRLVLVMIFREGYVVRACGLMLGCRDSVVQILQDEGLTRLS